MIKGKIIIVVTSLATVTNDIQLITNLLNKFHMYTTYKEGDNNTLTNYDDFKSILKAAVKDNRYKFLSTSTSIVYISKPHSNLKYFNTYPRTHPPHQDLHQDLAIEILDQVQ